MRPALAILAIFTGCARGVGIELPDSPAAAYVVVQLEQDAVTALYAFDAQKKLPIRRNAGTSIHVLEYGSTLERMQLFPHPNGVLEHVAATMDDEHWPLEPPARAYAIEDEFADMLVAADVTALLAKFSVKRPPCPPQWRFRPVDWSNGAMAEHHRYVAFALPFGPDVLIATPPSYFEGVRQQDAAVFVVRAATGTLEPLALASATAEGSLDTPTAFLDGEEDRAWIVWPADGRRYVLHSVSRDLEISPGIPTNHPADFRLGQVAGRRFDGRLTLFARTSSGTLFSYDETDATWTPIAESLSTRGCGLGSRNAYVLDVTGPGRAIFGRQGGEIVEVDLARPGPDKIVPQSAIVDDQRFCGNARAVMENGREVLVLRQSDDVFEVGRKLAERAPGDEWQVTKTIEAESHVALALGDLVFIGGPFSTITMFQGASRRPAHPLRRCGDAIGAQVEPYHLAPFADGRLFIGGKGVGAILSPTP